MRAPGGRSAAHVSVIAFAAAGAMIFTTSAWPLANGEPAPACSAPLLDGGRTINVADYRGKVVYLDFWASWCGPCRQSFPFMNELQREFGGNGLQIVAVSVDKTAEDAQRFLTRYPAQFATALDSSGVCPAAYRLQGMPSSYVIDRKGTVRAIHAGFRDRDKAEIRQQLIDALNAS